MIAHAERVEARFKLLPLRQAQGERNLSKSKSKTLMLAT
jgi:hypothetical protein